MSHFSFQSPELDEETLRSLSEILHHESRHYVAPIWWGTDPYDASTVEHNGSFFVVEIGEVRFCVTAYHVVTAFLECRQRSPNTRLLVRNVDISDWDARFIDGNEYSDVATFRVTDDEFKQIRIRPLRSEANKWPPPPPMVGRGVFFTGYPETGRRVLRPNAVEFLQISNGSVATSVDTNEIEVEINPAVLRSVEGRSPPPTTKNLSGLSGAPLLVVSQHLGAPFWLGGVVVRQMKASTEDQSTHVWARRPGFIMSDGKVRKSRLVRD